MTRRPDAYQPRPAGAAPMPRWLCDHLVENGTITASGIGRRARPRPCHRCHTTILTGLDDDVCAGVAVVDPTPLTAVGEAMALLAGRWTWSLSHRGGRYELDYRESWLIEDRPAGDPGSRCDVLPEHRCGDTSLEAFTVPSRFERKADYAALPDEPPF